MHADEPHSLVRRVADLESEVTKLRRRVAALEGLEATEPTPARLETQPLQPHGLVAAEPARPAPVMPPPLPASARAAAAPPVRDVAPGFEPPQLRPAVAFGSAPPPTPRSSPPPPPPEPARPSALRELLDALHLIPPSGTKAGEAGVGSWWATRIGALIFVIGVVFFGVFISRGTPPWVKLAELGAIAVGVALGGLWLERRIERMGAVILGSGLALGFFTAFAAYAVPAVKVIESVTVGALVQACAVVGIGAVAVLRRSATVATMAVLLGFVSAFFSFAEGFDDFAVVAGLALSVMAVFFRRREGWAVPVLLSAMLVHAVTALVAVEIWDTPAGARSAWMMFGTVAVAFGIHFFSLVAEGGGERGRIAVVQRWIQAINTSLAVLAGFLVALVALEEGDLTWYFFSAGAVLIAAAAWAWRFVPEDGIFGMFTVKAASLIALGVITEWDARTRWIALGVQAAVIMAAAVRTRRAALAITAVVAWLVSLLFFGADVDGLRGALVSSAGIAVALYGIGSAALLAWTCRWMRARGNAGASGEALTWVFACMAALPLLLALGVAWTEPWVVTACVVVSISLMLVARVLRSTVPIVPAGVAIVAGTGLVQMHGESALGWLWTGAGLIALVAGSLAWRAEREGEAGRRGMRAASVGLALLTLAALTGATMQSIAAYPALASGVALAVACGITGRLFARGDLVIAGCIGIALAWGLHVYHGIGDILWTGSAAWLWIAAAGTPVLLALGRVGESGLGRSETVARALAGAVGVLLVWMAAERCFGAAGLAWSVLGAAGVYAAIGRWRSSSVSSVAASALLVLSGAHFLMYERWTSGDQAWITLVGVFAGFLALAAAPLVRPGGAAAMRADMERAWRVLHGLGAAIGFCLIATHRGAAWADYGSVIWAIGGVALFVLGLAFRAKSHRVLGLVELGLCIPRVFLYDIQSTHYRIAAFVVLGVLLLVVGFSYQKFRYLIDGPAPEAGSTDKPGEPDLKHPPA